MLEQLRQLFVGKKLLASHKNSLCDDALGFCVAINEAHGYYDLELIDGHHWSLIPDQIGDNFAEGAMPFSISRRRIEVVT